MIYLIQRTKLFILFILSFISFQTAIKAQQYKALPQSIFEVLKTPSNNGGKIEIIQPNRLLALVGRVSPKYGRVLANESSAQVAYGYRIIYFNSNDPKAKAIAYQRQEELKEIAPEYPTYIHFNAPFWHLQLGDFTTKEEAIKVMGVLKNRLPIWNNEAYIIRDRIRIVNSN